MSEDITDFNFMNCFQKIIQINEICAKAVIKELDNRDFKEISHAVNLMNASSSLLLSQGTKFFVKFYNPLDSKDNNGNKIPSHRKQIPNPQVKNKLLESKYTRNNFSLNRIDETNHDEYLDHLLHSGNEKLKTLQYTGAKDAIGKFSKLNKGFIEVEESNRVIIKKGKRIQ